MSDLRQNIIIGNKSLLNYIRDAFVFSAPLILFQILSTLSSSSITLIVAHYGIQFAAAWAIINSLSMAINIFVFGILNAVSLCLSYNHGSDKHENTQEILSTSTYLAIFLVFITIAIYFITPTYLKIMSQPYAVINIVRQYFLVAAYGVLPSFIVILLLQVLITARKTTLSFYTNLFRFVLMITLVFIFSAGYGGVTLKGINAASTAYVIVNWMTLPILLLFVNRTKFPMQVGIIFNNFNLKTLFKLLKIGMPIAFALIIELVLHVYNSIITGQISVTQQAIYLLFLQSVVAIVVIPFAISQCASINASYAYGANDTQAILKIFLSNLYIGVTIVTLICAALLIFSKEISLLFFPDFETLSAKDKHDIASIFMLTSVLLFIETIRLVIIGVLRGIHDVNIPLMINIISFLVIGIFACRYFVFNLTLGVKGAVLGELIAIICSTFLLALRLFNRIIKIYPKNPFLLNI